DHVAVLGGLVLRLARRLQVRGADRLHAEKDLAAAGARRLLDEPRDLPRQRVDLDHEIDLDPLLLAQADETVEDRLPAWIAREVVVGEKVVVDAALPVLAHRPL